MASSQHGISYTRQPQQPPVFETADELFEAIEDLIEKGLVQPFLDANNQLRLGLFEGDESNELLRCSTLEVAS
jgi:hypothetical protein